jgi:hypothetical protein
MWLPQMLGLVSNVLGYHVEGPGFDAHQVRNFVLVIRLQLCQWGYFWCSSVKLAPT